MTSPTVGNLTPPISKRAGTAVMSTHRLETAKPSRYTYITPWANGGVIFHSVFIRVNLIDKVEFNAKYVIARYI